MLKFVLIKSLRIKTFSHLAYNKIMCGRFVRKKSCSEIAAAFEIDTIKTELGPSYNIAPTQDVLAVVANPRGTRGLVALKWGLIPEWAKDPSIASKLINARSESAHEKPSFRDSLRHRRCLIPASGFYEWPTGSRQPVYIHCQDQESFAFAGLYSFWQSPDGKRIATCAILTTAANPKIAAIHHRMPVILKPEDHALWLDKAIQQPEQVQGLLEAYAAEQTAYHAVSPQINTVSYNQPEAIESYLEDTGFLADLTN